MAYGYIHSTKSLQEVHGKKFFFFFTRLKRKKSMDFKKNFCTIINFVFNSLLPWTCGSTKTCMAMINTKLKNSYLSEKRESETEKELGEVTGGLGLYLHYSLLLKILSKYYEIIRRDKAG